MNESFEREEKIESVKCVRTSRGHISNLTAFIFSGKNDNAALNLCLAIKTSLVPSPSRIQALIEIPVIRKERAGNIWGSLFYTQEALVINSSRCLQVFLLFYPSKICIWGGKRTPAREREKLTALMTPMSGFFPSEILQMKDEILSLRVVPRMLFCLMMSIPANLYVESEACFNLLDVICRTSKIFIQDCTWHH